jgi:hypothetical protein
VSIGKNQNKPVHIESRRKFFDDIAKQLKVPGLKFFRDHTFDDDAKMRGAGIRGEYESFFSNVPGLKEGLVLELGFDQTTPYIECDITSWAIEKALTLNLPIFDNRAKSIPCYSPEYTFVEKLQTISTKYRLREENDEMPINFLRHYYDVYKLLENDRVLRFVGTEEYHKHKDKRFRSLDEKVIAKNPAFIISDKIVRALFAKEFQKKSAIYFGEQPSFDNILKRIASFFNQL